LQPPLNRVFGIDTHSFTHIQSLMDSVWRHTDATAPTAPCPHMGVNATSRPSLNDRQYSRESSANAQADAIDLLAIRLQAMEMPAFRTCAGRAVCVWTCLRTQHR
jgi:hypothetical protein